MIAALALVVALALTPVGLEKAPDVFPLGDSVREMIQAAGLQPAGQGTCDVVGDGIAAVGEYGGEVVVALIFERDALVTVGERAWVFKVADGALSGGRSVPHPAPGLSVCAAVLAAVGPRA